MMAETQKEIENSDEPLCKKLKIKRNCGVDTDSIEKNVEKESKFQYNNFNEISKLEYDVIKQIEYYFGDANLLRDKFLLEQMSKDSEGWIPFDVLMTFKRLKALTTDINTIVNALAKSEGDLVEISENKTKIRRHPERPIPKYNEEIRKEIESRTAYVKGFSLNMEISELIEVFNKFTKVENVTMRKYLDRNTKMHKFKGSVFVQFAKREQCEAFINQEKFQYKEKDLIKMWQVQYFEKKNKQLEEKRNKNKIILPKGAVLHFNACNGNLNFEDIKKAFLDLDTSVAFIQYTVGSQDGYIRLPSENGANDFLNKLVENKLKIGDATLKFRVLTGEEEDEFIKKATTIIASRINLNRNKYSKSRKSNKISKRLCNK